MALAPLSTLRRIGLAKPKHERLLEVLTQALVHGRGGRRDVAVTELCHAVQVAYGYREVTPELRARLDQIVSEIGGFR